MISEIFSCFKSTNFMLENINIFLSKFININNKNEDCNSISLYNNDDKIETKEITGVDFLENEISEEEFDHELDNISKSLFFCAVCQENKSNNNGIVTTKCGHKFCIDCYSRYCHSLNPKEDSDDNEINCPLCRELVTSIPNPNYGKLVEMLEREKYSEDLSSLQVLSTKGSKTYTVFIFVQNDDNSSRAITPTNDLTDSDQRDKIFNDTLNNLATNVQETWRTLRTHRPEEEE